jgi:hypothetical protein
VDRVSYCAELKQVGRLELTIVLDAILLMAAEKYEEMLVSLIYQLKKKGAQVDLISWWLHNDSGPSTRYDKPLSEWEEKIRTDSVFVSTEWEDLWPSKNADFARTANVKTFTTEDAAELRKYCLHFAKGYNQ